MGELAGRLSERVRFEGRMDVRGAAGDRVGDWSLLFERWAQVEPVARADRAAEAADTRHAARRWKVTLRAGVEPTLDMRLRWRGLILSLTGIEMNPGKPGLLVVWAEDAGG